MIDVLKVDEWIGYQNAQFDVLERSDNGKIRAVMRIIDGVEYRVSQTLWEEYYKKQGIDYVVYSYIRSFNEDRKHVEIHNKLINQEEVIVVKSYGEEPWEINDLPAQKMIVQ